ncbi:hypothetical protein RDI58_014173 [Solanum bulbocastanum]|uniref:Uncharacterized protein n=1 Tax=Solanum bulbocastanum TaxID=147425 RepID=A0AAN8TTA9_SOLBU
MHVEISRAGLMVGPAVGILALPLLEGEYKNLALFAALLGTISFAFMLMFIAPITTDFGLLNILIGATVKLSWENEDAEILIWARTGIACVVILIIRYLVDREVRMRIAREVEWLISSLYST